MRRKYKIKQEYVLGELVYCGYKYILGIFPWYIIGTGSGTEEQCESKIRDYDYARKPWYRIFYIGGE